jgi:hypothetical protein
MVWESPILSAAKVCYNHRNSGLPAEGYVPDMARGRGLGRIDGRRKVYCVLGKDAGMRRNGDRQLKGYRQSAVVLMKDFSNE